MSEYVPYNQKTMTIDEYNTLSPELRNIIEMYEIVIQSIENKDKINAKCSCGCTIHTKFIPKFIMEDICCASCNQLNNGMDTLQQFAIMKNGKCLSGGKYLGSKQYYTWQCNNCECTWKAAWYAIKCKGSWCPTCSSGLSENICRHALEEITGHKFPKISNFAKSDTNKGFEIDCYNEELKLGLEYDGIQHYKHTQHFHGDIDSGKFEAQQIRDINKNKKCEEMGVTLIRVAYTTPRAELRTHVHSLIRGLILESKLSIELVNSEHFISNIEFNNNVSKICSEKSDVYMDRIRPIIKSKNAILHSTSCGGRLSPIEITCKNNHNFITNLDNLFHNPPRWCPECASNRTLKESHVREILEPKGYELIKISREYDSYGKKRLYITYKCDNNHVVYVAWDNHSNTHKRCPDCVLEEQKIQIAENARIREDNRKPTKKEKEHEYALSIGYNIGSYNNALKDLTEIRCIAHNHIFYALPCNILSVENCNKEYCSQCVLQNDFPNLEIDYTNLVFSGNTSLISTKCTGCGYIFEITNKSIPERRQCCKNLKCKYNDKDKGYKLQRSCNKYENRYNGSISRTIEYMNKTIEDYNNIKQNKKHEKLQAIQTSYQNHPDYIIPVFTNKTVSIQFECRKYNHRFKSKIITLDRFPELELCAQCILIDDYPYHTLEKEFDFLDDKIDTNKLYLICKCGKKSNIAHKSLRKKNTKFCTWKQCKYYDQYNNQDNPVRYIDKSKSSYYLIIR
jgi:hypothetical protein